MDSSIKKRVCLPESVIIVSDWANRLVSTPHNSGRSALCSQIVSIAEQLHASAMLLALVMAPVATKLPKTLNSVLWISQGKDTLALGNITGAMLFHSCIPVVSGIVFTTWTLGPVELFSAALALTAGLWVYVLAAKAKLTAPAPFLNGIIYLLFLSIVLMGSGYRIRGFLGGS